MDDAGGRLSFVGRDALVARLEATGHDEQRAIMRACARAIGLRRAVRLVHDRPPSGK